MPCRACAQRLAGIRRRCSQTTSSVTTRPTGRRSASASGATTRTPVTACWSVGEALMATQSRVVDAETIVAAWLESPHRAILLSPTWRDAGIGVLYRRAPRDVRRRGRGRRHRGLRAQGGTSRKLVMVARAYAASVLIGVAFGSISEAKPRSRTRRPGRPRRSGRRRHGRRRTGPSRHAELRRARSSFDRHRHQRGREEPCAWVSIRRLSVSRSGFTSAATFMPKGLD